MYFDSLALHEPTAQVKNLSEMFKLPFTLRGRNCPPQAFIDGKTGFHIRARASSRDKYYQLETHSDYKMVPTITFRAHAEKNTRVNCKTVSRCARLYGSTAQYACEKAVKRRLQPKQFRRSKKSGNHTCFFCSPGFFLETMEWRRFLARKPATNQT
ncbi:hypothetical protein PsorP6_003251 [Peronosclerospora sorghi]|uniref:Uncharacterized protein n=1 Tax=Peronosclerospora sorghi TaxID=230839 RepID=A0ACC0VJ01_9STRA|nr:hypothetical protein PsorP6_003251 [Peronosclerospora sorghi]